MPRSRALPLLLAVVLITGAAAAGSPGELEASFDADSTLPEGTTTLDTTADAGTTLEITADGIEPAMLARTVEGSIETADGVRVTVGENGTVPVSFPGYFHCHTGEYTFAVRNPATNATATAAIELVSPVDVRTTFAEATARVEPGGQAEIPLEFGCHRTVTVAVGGEDTPFRAAVTMATTEDREPYGRTTVVFDTAAVATGSPDEILSAGENATVERATVERRPDAEPLPEGTYPLTLRADGRERDVLVLEVTTEATATVTETGTDVGATSPTASSPATGSAEPGPGAGTGAETESAGGTASPADAVQPGFGIASGVVAGAVAAALLSVRRRRRRQ